MKRLFALKEPTGHLFQAIPRSSGPLCFETESEARERMDEVNFFRDVEDKVSVTYGPDHPQYSSKKR